MPKQHLFLALVVYIATAVGSFFAFSAFLKQTATAQSDDLTTQAGSQSDQTALGTLLTINPSDPKDQACPLNGKLYTKVEREAWEKRRPLYVMIENHTDARPQSGLADADVVFEAVAEGGITRFGALFYCGVQADDTTLAPIRSARTYFVDWASGFNRPMYVHVGGANVPGPSDALGQIGDYGWNGTTDINQFSVGYPTFVRDYNRVPGKEIATEHTMVTSTEKLWAVATKRGWTNLSPEQKVGKKVVPATDWKDGFTGWTFADEPMSDGTATTVSYDFWSGYNDFAVSWNYDSAKKAYLRTMGGEKHLDANSNEQIAAANVVVLYATEKGPINEKKHMLYGTTGKGEAVVFMNGNAVKASWTKKDRESELQFFDAKGKPLALQRGLTWISVLAVGAEVSY